MASWYTGQVQNGNVTELKSFALLCARNFGACIMQRDEAMDAPLRLEKCSDDYQEVREDLERDLETYTAWSEQTASNVAAEQYAKACKRHEQVNLEKALQRTKYEDMLAKVKEWEPPTTQHQGLKDFMIGQLEEAIEVDCTVREGPEPPLPGAAYRLEMIQMVQRSIARHEETRKLEETAVRTRNEWKSQLLQAFGEELK